VGRPAPQGSKRHVGGNRFVEASKYLKPWRNAISKAAKDSTPADWYASMAMSVTITFILPRPKSHFRTNGKLKDNAPRLCTTRIGDIDKLCRATLDSLSGSVNGGAGVFDDDCQVFDLHAERRYAVGYEKPGAIITVTAIND
jgi:crossover junction endodeoxyribonuclease RusA